MSMTTFKYVSMSKYLWIVSSIVLISAECFKRWTNGNIKTIKYRYKLVLFLGSCCDWNDESITKKFSQPFLFCFGLLFFTTRLSNESKRVVHFILSIITERSKYFPIHWHLQNHIINYNLLSAAILAIPVALLLLGGKIQFYDHSLVRIQCYVSHIQMHTARRK